MRKHTLLILLSLFAAPLVRGAALQLKPISVTFSAEESARTILLSNTGTQLLRAQVRAYRWTQENGTDVLRPSDEIYSSPPMLEIPEGKPQLVRVIRQIRQTQRNADESAYRLIVDELPSVANTAHPTNVQFLLRYSIPIFVPSGDALSTPDEEIPLRVSVQNRGDEATLRIDNPRHNHVKLTRLVVMLANGKSKILHDGLLGYVLAGQSRVWHLPHLATEGRLIANVNDGRVPTTLLVYH